METAAPGTSSQNNSDKGTSFLKSSNEFLGFIVGIVTSILSILTQADAERKIITPETFLILVDILNILILIIGLSSIKGEELLIEDKETKQVEKHLSIENYKDFTDLLARTNELIKQLTHSIRWFIIILGIFYLIQLFIDTIQPPYELITKTLAKEESFTGLISSDEANKEIAAKYLAIEFLTNAANIFSAAYLFFGFSGSFLTNISLR